MFDVLRIDLLLFTCFGGDGIVGVFGFVLSIFCAWGKGTFFVTSGVVMFLLVKNEALCSGYL